MSIAKLNSGRVYGNVHEVGYSSRDPIMATRLIVLVLVVSLLLPLTTRADGEGIVNKVVTTTLDLTTHIAKITVSVTLENNGDKAVNHVQYLLDPLLADKLAYINAEVSSHSLSRVPLLLPSSLRIDRWP